MANVEGYSTQRLYTLEDFEKHINQTTHAFYEFVENSVDAFSYKKNAEKQIVKPKLSTWLLSENLREKVTKPKEGDYPQIASDQPQRIFFMNSQQDYYESELTLEHPIGMFETTDVNKKRDFFDRLVKAEVLLEFLSLDKQVEQSMPVCYNWLVTLRYQFNVRGGLIKCQFLTDHLDCSVNVKYNAFEAKFVSPFFYLFLVTLIFSILKLIMSAVENTKIMIYYIRIQKLKKENIIEKSRTKKGKFSLYKFFNNLYDEVPIITIWTVLDISKDVFNIIGCLLFVLPTPYNLSNRYTTFTLLFLGIGAMCSFGSFVKYFQFWPQFYFLIVALRIATPFSLKYLVGIMPLYIGFCFAGLVWFGHYVPYFSTLDITSVTLFSAMHGDIIRDDFNMLYAFNDGFKILGRVYLYTFILLFILVILTMFLLITEEAYFSLWEGEEDEENKILNLGKFDITKKLKQFDDLMTEREEQHLIDSMQAQDASMEVFYSYSLISAVETKIKERKDRPLNKTEQAIIRFMQRYAAQFFKAVHENDTSSSSHLNVQHTPPINPRDSVAVTFDEL